MRKIIAGAFQSIDGVIQSPGAPTEDASNNFELGGWGVHDFDEKVGAFMGRMMGGEFELLLGRTTFDMMFAYWSKVQNDPFADQLNTTHKHVLTSSTDDLGWNSSTLGHIAAIETLKRQDGPDLIIQGSHTLHGELTERGLVDRLFLLTFPVVLATGKRLFDMGGRAGRYNLIEQEVSPSGVIMAVYDYAGGLRIGAFSGEGREVPR